MSSVIRVEKLSKRYVLRHKVARGASDSGLRHAIERGVGRAASRISNLFRGSPSSSDKQQPAATEEFWALKDVSFEIQQGHCVGIIGRNGAGKSTLLKILSRITEPTHGKARLRGRVGCLLEVGTGFHPELTGRENVFLNGAILGMRRSEVLRKFHDIVSYAEVDKFIDTPVKYYSSGMYVRLAFAVAAHLEPDILVVDEVLAVGDAQFQKKCTGTMDAVAKSGRTVLFVSHNMAAVRQLCTRTLHLKGGQLHAEGPTADVIQSYFDDCSSSHVQGSWVRKSQDLTSKAVITSLSLRNKDGETVADFSVGDPLTIALEITFNEELLDPQCGCLIHTADGDAILDLRTRHLGWNLTKAHGSYAITAHLPYQGLYPGTYFLSAWINNPSHSEIDWLQHVVRFEVHPILGPYGDMRFNFSLGKYYAPSQWTVQQITPGQANASSRASLA